MNDARPVINPSLPYIGLLPSPIEPGKFVRIVGSALLTTKTFTCNLHCGENIDDDAAISLKVQLIEQNILIKSKVGTWQLPKIYENSSIVQGQQFEILIICEPTVFKIGICGKHLCEYSHQTPCHTATHIRIEGDVSISLISVESTDSKLHLSPTKDNMSYPPPYSQQATAPPPIPGYPQPNQPGYPPSNQTGYSPSNQTGYPPSNQPGFNQGYPPNPNPYPPPSGTFVNDPLINQQGNIAAANASPRVYQPPFWSRSLGYGRRGDRKSTCLAFGLFGIITLAIIIFFLTLALTNFHRHQRRSM